VLVVDGAVGGALVGLAGMAVLLALNVKATPQGLVDAFHADPTQLLALPAVAVGVVTLYLLVPGLLFGATLAQRLVGLELVVQKTGEPASLLRLVIRSLLTAVFTALLLASPAWALLVDRWRRGLGDVLAGTICVRRSGG
jgi:uncharacterized RDD family membrane protein YckC